MFPDIPDIPQQIAVNQGLNQVFLDNPPTLIKWGLLYPHSITQVSKLITRIIAIACHKSGLNPPLFDTQRNIKLRKTTSTNFVDYLGVICQT